MSKKLYPEEDIRNIANAIREKSGTQDSYYISGMSNAILNIPSGGGEDHNTLKSLIEGTLTDITSDAEEVGRGVFANYSSLRTANFTNATLINSNAFYNCSKLNNIYGAKVQSIGEYAFFRCYNLINAYFPNTVSLYNLAFVQCNNLSDAIYPSLERINVQSFDECHKLVNTYFPMVRSIKDFAFHNCYSLSNAYFPNATNIYGNAFSNCYSLSNAYFPNANLTWPNAFEYCTGLTNAYLLNIKTVGIGTFYQCNNLLTTCFKGNDNINIRHSVFKNCYNFNTLIINSNKLSILDSINAFNNTSFTNNLAGGNLYVPQALLEDYKVANQWNLLYAMENVNFLPIEGSPYEIV